MRQPDSAHGHGRLQEDHDSFPIHLIGLIQPHGVLMVLTAADFTIVQISGNAEIHLDVTPQALLGRPLSDLLPTSSVERLHQLLSTCFEQPRYIPIAISAGREVKKFDGLVHRINESIILELEPVSGQTAVEPTSLQNDVQCAIARLRQIDDITNFLQSAVTEIQAITGYDRVMVYQFDENQAGSVVAEVKPAQDVSYLGLHYPATDIPSRARQLYQQSTVRYMPALTAPPVELLAAAETPLDLSYAVLRGTDPCCIDYHQNMGVTALLVIALVRNNQLWGLITCQHPTEKHLPYVVRSSCEILGQLIAAELASKVNQNELSYLNTLKAIQSDFIESIATAQNFKQALVHPEPRLLEMVNAQGAAVCLDQDITLIGNTPPLADVRALIDWSMAETSGEIFHTDCLSQEYPAATRFQSVASGLIVLTISQLRRYVILWFRPEILKTVSWAGNPDEGIQKNDHGEVILCPRNSFQEWQETVEATSLPWQSAEIENALALRNAIVGIVLNKADELAQINQELERSNRELDSFAYAASHDLKEPLRGITNFSNIILRRYSHSLDESAIKRLRTLVKLAERMDSLIDALLRFSRLGQAELNHQPTDLNVLVADVIDELKMSREDRMPSVQIAVSTPLPMAIADPDLITEVFINLLSNALKYTEKTNPKIEVGCLSKAEQQTLDRDIAPNACVIYVRDDGIGIPERHFQNIFRLFKRLHERDSYGGGTGVGLTVAKKIIERHGGQIWVESRYGEGTTFYFVLNCEEN